MPGGRHPRTCVHRLSVVAGELAPPVNMDYGNWNSPGVPDSTRFPGTVSDRHRRAAARSIKVVAGPPQASRLLLAPVVHLVGLPAPRRSSLAEPSPLDHNVRKGWAGEMLTCHEFLTELGDYLDNLLPSNVREKVERHMEECPNCWVIADTTRKTVALYRGQVGTPLSAEEEERTRLAIERRTRTVKPPA
jgi:hypothetical protein